MKANLKKSVQQFIGLENERGRLICIAHVLRAMYEPGRISPRRWLYLFLFLIHVYLLGYRPQFVNWRGRGSRFYIAKRRKGDGFVVLKFPRFDNSGAYKLVRSINSELSLQNYKHTLYSLGNDQYIGAHIPDLYSINFLGGYRAKWVDGETLSQIATRIKCLTDEVVQSEVFGLDRAVRQLLSNLESYWDNTDSPAGDWALHNLVFDKSTGVIKNIDLEGFFTYHSGALESTREFVTGQILAFNEILRLMDCRDKDSERIRKVLGVCWYATQSGTSYSGKDYLAGYHTVEILQRKFLGQRDCRARLANVPYNFDDKAVLDLGCNSGGMLHILSPRISEGIGLDYDYRQINAANLVSQVNGLDNIHCYTFNFDHESVAILDAYLPSTKVDIIFFLSMCAWVSRWRLIIDYAVEKSKVLLFETNGTETQQRTQLEYVQNSFNSVEIVHTQSTDDPYQKRRRLYLCRNS